MCTSMRDMLVYKKLEYSLEFVREDKDPKLSKYFYSKAI